MVLVLYEGGEGLNVGVEEESHAKMALDSGRKSIRCKCREDDKILHDDNDSYDRIRIMEGADRDFSTYLGWFLCIGGSLALCYDEK